jgi:hypothetical protein
LDQALGRKGVNASARRRFDRRQRSTRELPLGSRVDVVLLRGDRSSTLGIPDFHHVWRTLGANAIVREDLLGSGGDFLTGKYQRFAIAVVELKHHELILQIASR